MNICSPYIRVIKKKIYKPPINYCRNTSARCRNVECYPLYTMNNKCCLRPYCLSTAVMNIIKVLKLVFNQVCLNE